MTITDLLAWLVAVGVLLIVVFLLIFFVRNAIFKKELVIAPFHVTGREDPDGHLGRSLALMLHGRMRQVQREFEASQQELISSESPSDDIDLGARALLGPLSLHKPITISTMVATDSPSLDVKVAGIEFGGIAAWLSQVAARKRTLIFAVYFGEHEALVTANLHAIPDIAGGDLWMQTNPAPGEVVTALAYAVLQARMAKSSDTVIGALEPGEFRTLLTNLSTIADLNRRIASGRSRSAADFRRVLDDLTPLLEKVPEWPELIYLVAQVAERTDDTQRALALYQRLDGLADGQRRPDPAMRRAIDRKISTLGGAAQSTTDVRERDFLDAVRSYERTLGFPPPHPDVAFMETPDQYYGAHAVWNEELQRYEVNPDSVADSKLELAKYTVLMGRFMAQHYGRCQGTPPADFWNTFRISVVEFLIGTEPDTSYQVLYQSTLLNVLDRIKQACGVEAVRRLALSLLDRYDCDWTAANLPDKLVAVGSDVNMSEDVIRSAFAEAAVVTSQFLPG